MNKYVLSLSLLALANAFQPAQSMNWISQQNKDRIAKYGPCVAVGTAAAFASFASVYTIKQLVTANPSLYRDIVPFGPFDPQNIKGTLHVTLRGQIKQLGYVGLSALTAYMSTPNTPTKPSSTPVLATESRAASALANLKNTYETAKKEFNTLSPRTITYLKVAGTFVAAALAAKAAHSISSLETACYMRNSLAFEVSLAEHIARKLVSPFTLGWETIKRYPLALAVTTGIVAGTGAAIDDI